MKENAALAAWQDACARLSRLGAEVIGEPFPTGETEQVEMLAHLVDQAVCWLGWSVFHADPRRPVFHRQNDLVTQWGGPNADNVYHHARIDAARRYRINGQMNSCEDWVLTIRRGFMHQPTWGTVHQVTAHALGIAEGDHFELILGGEPAGERWVPLPDGSVMATLREYYYDWRPLEPARMTIECLDDDLDAPSPPLGAGELAARLADAVTGIEHSLRYWNEYLEGYRAAGVANTFAEPITVGKGLADAHYAFCFWDLADDDALVVTTTVPAARHWSFQLYMLGTFEPVDLLEHQSSLNQTQLGVDPDGLVRVVLAQRDPGVTNWLDAAGRRHGLMTYRTFWAGGAPLPEVTTEVVPLGELDRRLATSARSTPAERAATLAARRAHLVRRFRT